jgi:hypothetical protein
MCSSLPFEATDEGINYRIGFGKLQKERRTLTQAGIGTAYTSVAGTTVSGEKA